MPSLFRKIRRYLRSPSASPGGPPLPTSLVSLTRTPRRASTAIHFPVTSMADSGPNTLRQAILNANANPGADIITFNISGPGVQEIQPLSALPPITGSVRLMPRPSRATRARHSFSWTAPWPEAEPTA